MSQNVGRAVPGQGYVRVTVRPTLLAGQKCPKLVRVQETKLDERAPCSYGGPTTGSVAFWLRCCMLAWLLWRLTRRLAAHAAPHRVGSTPRLRFTFDFSSLPAMRT
jgi:hypothetical protein